MTDGPKTMNEADLDRWLDEMAEEARLATPEPSADLFARVLGDAEAAQAGFAQAAALATAETARARRTDARPWWAAILASIGGGPGVAGLCSAMVAGIWFGYSPPDALSTSIDLSVLGSSAFDELVADDYLAIDDFLVDG